MIVTLLLKSALQTSQYIHVFDASLYIYTYKVFISIFIFFNEQDSSLYQCNIDKS